MSLQTRSKFSKFIGLSMAKHKKFPTGFKESEPKPKKKLPRPKNPAPPFPNEQGEFDASGKVGVSERSTLE